MSKETNVEALKCPCCGASWPGAGSCEYCGTTLRISKELLGGEVVRPIRELLVRLKQEADRRGIKLLADINEENGTVAAEVYVDEGDIELEHTGQIGVSLGRTYKGHAMMVIAGRAIVHDQESLTLKYFPNTEEMGTDVFEVSRTGRRIMGIDNLMIKLNQEDLTRRFLGIRDVPQGRETDSRDGLLGSLTSALRGLRGLR